jgi:ribonuclease E
MPGRYLVLMPLAKKTGISRKIQDVEARQELRKVLNQVTSPEEMGYIVRTAGMGKTREQIQRDLNVLQSTWKEILSRAEVSESPCLLYLEDNVVNRTIRDYFSEDIEEILIDDQTAFEEILAYFNKMMPNFSHIVKPYKGKSPIFSKYQLEEQIEKIFSRKIKLPSGGSIVIEQTEALVVIDVNSGKTSEGNLELTALKTNVEAAEEVARQLRLRDLGGLIVIDFIDLRERRHVFEVEKTFKAAVKQDKARITITPLSRFGLLEMSRQRIKTSKEIKHYVDCPACAGAGRIKSIQTQAIDLLRRIKMAVSPQVFQKATVTCSEELGLHLLNTRREELLQLEHKQNCVIIIQIRPGYFGLPRIEVEKQTQEEKDKMELPPPLSLSSVTASMSEEAINRSRDFRQERLDAVEKMTFEELRGQDIQPPKTWTSLERFNFSVRVSLMKTHGLFQDLEQDFREALRVKILDGEEVVAASTEDLEEDSLVHDDLTDQE